MKKIIILSAIVALLASSNAFGQQQQYANAYAYWKFGEGVENLNNVEQNIWIARSARGSQWVMMWSWLADPAHGGYFGFNTDSDGKAQALFSLWNADAAKGENCQEFGGEGEGWSCRMPFELRSNTVYKLRLTRTRVDEHGVWWGGWISEGLREGEERSIGEIRVKKQMNGIRAASIMNFSEYFGDVVKECRSVPFSVLALAPPTTDRVEEGKTYARSASSNGSSDPASNPCRTGKESQGSLFKVESFDFAGKRGAIIYFGGPDPGHFTPKGLTLPGT